MGAVDEFWLFHFFISFLKRSKAFLINRPNRLGQIPINLWVIKIDHVALIILYYPREHWVPLEKSPQLIYKKLGKI